MESNHNPGPWYAGSTGNHQGLVISQQDGRNIAVTYDKKDAPIVAAAPEMRDALEDVREVLLHFRQAPDWNNEHQQAYDKLRSAIEKSTNFE